MCQMTQLPPLSASCWSGCRERLSHLAQHASALPGASGIIRRVAEAGPDYVERMWAMSDAKWIPVSERLPGPDFMGNAVGVLVCLPDGEVCIGFCGNDEYGVRWHCQSTQSPTHWMPLPEPLEVK